MNIDRTNPDHEREWQAQERALREVRAGCAPSNDPLLASYRSVARALRQPLPDALPADFAQIVAKRAFAAHTPLDLRFEQALMRNLVVVLALSAAVATALYGSVFLQALAALMPASSSTVAFGWALALAGCVGLSWSFELLRRRIAAATLQF
jgi:hypothetical protein